MLSRELEELMNEIKAGPHCEFFGENLLPLVHQIRTLEAECVLLGDGIKKAHDAVILVRRENAKLTKRIKMREGGK